ncbi:C39 family peptidase [Candidatus Woesearchaeota archaeon]|nr:C39 family peptidase [Candidatus Woesearchaeota archaeon]
MVKVVLDVPKIKQITNYCVPASLSMIFEYYGNKVSQENIASWFGYDIKESGVKSCEEIVKCARDQGFSVRAKENIGLEGIIKLIDKGSPLLVVIRANVRGARHVLVVRGYETDPNILWVNDPLRLTKEKQLYSNFRDLWRIRRKYVGTNHYGVIIQP